MKFKTVDEYILHAPSQSKAYLKAIRSALLDTLEDAEELISYNMPAFKMKKILVYYAANEKHIGFYPTPSGISAFEDQLKGNFKYAKGSVQIPYNNPLPVELIKKIAAFRLKEVKTSNK